jgi:Flp pilus assembly pilin Flp
MTPTRRRTIDLADDRGQSLTEYSLLITLIAVAAVVAIPGIASAIGGIFSAATSAIGG